MPAPGRSRLFRKALQRMAAVTGFDKNAPYFYFYGADTGESGIATGFGNVTLVYVRKLHGLSGSITGIVRGRGADSGTGWNHCVDAGGIWGQYNGFAGAKYLLTPNDVGRLLVLVTRITAVPGTIDTIVNRVQLPSVALTAYTPNTTYKHYLGVDTAGTPTDAVDYVASLDFRGVPTIAQLQALCDTIRSTGNAPSSFTGGTVTHRHSLIDALAGTAWVDGQAAPATLTDTITVATADQLVRSNAALTVREILRSEGRHQLGLTGYAANAILESTGSGIQGAATGLTLMMPYRVTGALSPGVYEYPLNTYNAGSTAGYSFYSHPGDQTMRFYAFGMGEMTLCPLSALQTDSLLGVTWDGATWRGYVNGVQTVQVVSSGFTPNTGGKMRVGSGPSGGSPALLSTVGGVAGCDQALTAGEVADLYRNWVASGRLTLPVGKTNPHAYDFALDLLNASPFGSVPETFTDRAGTDHLKRTGGLTALSTGIKGFSTGDFIRSLGIAFAGSASGFSGEIIADLVLADFASAGVIACSGNTSAASGGWVLMTYGSTGAPLLRFFMINTSNVAVEVTFSVTVGTRHISWSYDGSVYRVYLDGVLAATSTSFTYKPTVAGWLTLGGQPNNAAAAAYPLIVSTMRGISGGNFIWSAGEIATASSTGRAAGKVQGVPSKTTLRHSLVDDVVEAGGLLPGVIKERVSGADNLVVIDQGLRASRRAERAYGYDVSPVNYGARNWSAANYLAGPNTGFAHSATMPYWFFLVLFVHAKAGGAFQCVATKALTSGAQGMNLYASNTLGTLNFTHGLGGGAANAPTYTVLDSDLNRPLILAYQWNGAVLQAFAKRARNGSDITAATYAPYSGNLMLGRHSDTTSNPGSDNFTVVGLMGGTGVLSLGEYLGAYDGYYANNDLVEVPGKTARLWSQRRAALANAGALAAIVDAQGSGETLAITGTPTISPVYAHAA